MIRATESHFARELLNLAKFRSLYRRPGERFSRLAAEVRGRIREIPPEEALARAGHGALLIDVREPYDFARGHAAGAENIPKGAIETEIESRTASNEVEIICYCDTGDRAALVVENLRRMGYANAVSLAGGLHAWLEKKLPVIRRNRFLED